MIDAALTSHLKGSYSIFMHSQIKTVAGATSVECRYRPFCRIFVYFCPNPPNPSKTQRSMSNVGDGGTKKYVSDDETHCSAKRSRANSIIVLPTVISPLIKCFDLWPTASNSTVWKMWKHHDPHTNTHDFIWHHALVACHVNLQLT